MFSKQNFFFGTLLGLFLLVPLLVTLDLKSLPAVKTTSFQAPQINPLISRPQSIRIPQQKGQNPKDGNSVVSSKNGIPILMYHYIGHNPQPQRDPARDILSTSPEKFRTQLQFLSDNHFTPITLNTLYATLNEQIPTPQKAIVLTFDDGYSDFYFNAFPILSSFNFHSVSFIATGLVGKPSYMTWGQIKEINSSGLVDFEAHTVNHTNLVSLPYDKILWEMKTSREELQKQLSHPINFLAYPYGNSNALVWQAVKEAGFAGALGTWEGRTSANGINMPRIRVNGGISLEEFERLVSQ